ncbi:DUF397 domain-containing protein [Actinomadura geliboluensis]|uniref:DUF397 domain-containing protein n=1 Tax=Actinomadura geliboluensis TaxID=882440 RepID=UPI003719C5E0
MTPVWRKASYSGSDPAKQNCVEVAQLWRKSSHSGSSSGQSDCVEVAQLWRKSSRSGTSGHSDCVEVAQLTAKVGVRDSKAPEAPHLVFDVADWRRFADRVKRGEHDLA